MNRNHIIPNMKCFTLYLVFLRWKKVNANVANLRHKHLFLLDGSLNNLMKKYKKILNIKYTGKLLTE